MLWFPWARSGPGDRSPQDLQRQISTLQLGKVVNVVRSQSGALATGSTILPVDDTIPQVTEGDQYLSASITPTSASSILIVEFSLLVSCASNIASSAALFRDGAADALAAVTNRQGAAALSTLLALAHSLTAGSTASTTFTVRAGPTSANTLSVNGQAGARIFGGVASSSLTIVEVLP